MDAGGCWQIAEPPPEAPLRHPGIPAAYSKTPGAIRRLPPRLGEHSVEILREVGSANDETDALIASGASRTATR